MVENTTSHDCISSIVTPGSAQQGQAADGGGSDGLPAHVRSGRRIVLPLALAAGMAVVAIAWAGLSGPAASANATPVSSSSVRSTVATKVVSPAGVAPTSTTAPEATGTTGTTPATTTVTTSPAPVVASTPPTTVPSPVASIATMVAEVEAAGIVPGSSWTWTTGDSGANCGFPTGTGQASACTTWSAGVVRTVFDGVPSLNLVAHEIGNAETEQYAVPSLLSEVSAAAGGTSWSPTDAVASCLVEHFLGHQDNAAGTWQCPASLAASVATHIHDTVTTTQITAVCGTTSGTSSALTFAAGTGTLTVTSPTAGSTPQTAGPGSSVAVQGVGTFTATDVGGTATISGTCNG